MNKLISVVFVFLICMQSAISQPLKYDDEEWAFDDQPLEWEAAPVEITAGNLELKVWILHRLVPSPDNGYLVTKTDWIELRRMLDSIDEEIVRIKSVERLACDDSLVVKDLFCKNLNADLIKQIDDQVNTISLKDKEVKSVKKEILWTKIIAGTAIVGLSAFSIYQATK